MGFIRKQSPVLATIATDRWTLLDAEDRVREGATLFWIPPRGERTSCWLCSISPQARTQENAWQ